MGRLFIALLAMTMWGGLFTADGLADVFMRQKHQTDGFQMMGQTQPPRELMQKMWLTADRARSDMENQSIIVRLDRGVSYFLNHSRKAYAEIPLDSADRAEVRPGERAARDRRARSAPAITFRITETGEIKRVGGYLCRKYIQTMESPAGPVTTEIWATEDLRMDSDLYARFSLALMATQPGGREAMNTHVREMKKIRGVPVLSRTTSRIGGAEVKSSVELIEFREERAPGGLFDIPDGYSRQPLPGPGAERGGGRSEPPRRR